MKVVHIAFECAPMYKTGGLGDVIGSLPKALASHGFDPLIIIPKYGWVKHLPYLPGSRVPVWYTEGKWFRYPNVRHDQRIQAPKYAHFAMLALDALKRQDFKPDIIHCHDWHSALVPYFLKHEPDAFFAHTKTVLTIHNIAFQGRFPLSYLNHPEIKKAHDLFPPQTRRISFMKAGVESADRVTTVSPHHAEEITSGKVDFGMTTVIRRRHEKLIGILNGIDYSVWNPATDPLINGRYNKETIFEKKGENKLKLQKQLGLEENPGIPVFGFIARLSSQKGIDLLLPLLEHLPERRLEVVILGAGEKEYIDALKKLLTENLKRWLSVTIAFDERLAHAIYAGSDFFLIPSHYEPCGLTQMISMKYGTLPVAIAVGGLKDTIIDGKTGLLAKEATYDSFTEVVDRAVSLWEDQPTYQKMVTRAMEEDFSWEKRAKEYIKLYNLVIYDV